MGKRHLTVFQINIMENGICVVCWKNRCEILSLWSKNRPLRKCMPRQTLLRNLEQKMTLHCKLYQYITQNPNLLSLITLLNFFFFFLCFEFTGALLGFRSFDSICTFNITVTHTKRLKWVTHTDTKMKYQPSNNMKKKKKSYTINKWHSVPQTASIINIPHTPCCLSYYDCIGLCPRRSSRSRSSILL